MLVSLYSLRKHYAGRVTILATPEVGEWVSSMAIGTGAGLAYIDLVKMRRNSAHVTKTALHRWTPYDVSLFIDADTLPVADPSELFDLCSPQAQVVLTHFKDWKVGEKGIVHNRVKSFAQAAGRMDLFEKCIGSASLNTGVYCFRKTASLLEPAFELCKAGCSKFIPDECSWQLLYRHHPHVLLEDEYNYSPLYSKGQPKIIHMHGSKCLAPRVKNEWLAALSEVWDQNVGNVRQWLPERDKQTYLRLVNR
jgi:hypothetical protein